MIEKICKIDLKIKEKCECEKRGCEGCFYNRKEVEENVDCYNSK